MKATTRGVEVEGVRRCIWDSHSDVLDKLLLILAAGLDRWSLFLVRLRWHGEVGAEECGSESCHGELFGGVGDYPSQSVRR